MGGFADFHHSALGELEVLGLVKVVATCDPGFAGLGDCADRHRFSERGVLVYPELESLLASHGNHLDLITVSSPIHVHARHHLACVNAGVSCYLEKPPTLDPEELEVMIEVERKAVQSTQVGFHYIAQPWRLNLKERLLRGDFGKLHHVGFKGTWRRSLSYYERNSWAGRLFHNNELLLDSCCGNAMSHFLHNMLFHAGRRGVFSWAVPQTVEAELYRANQIEAPDTVFARGMLEDDVTFCLAVTHACEARFHHIEVLECENASIEISELTTGLIKYRDGREERFPAVAASLRENLRGYCEFLMGSRERPVTTLADCRPFVGLDALLYLAAPRIHPVEEAVSLKVEDDLRETRCIPGIEAACEKMLREGKFPTGQLLSWGRPGGKSTQADLPRLREALLRLQGW